MNTRLLSALTTLVFASSVHAAVIGSMTTPPPISQERIRADVPRSEQAAWLAYLDRSEKQMAQDKAALEQERKNPNKAESAIAPPGRNASSLPLDRDAAFYASPQAATLATNLLSYQTPAGGWSKNLNFAGGVRQPGQSYVGDVGMHVPVPAGQVEPPSADNWSYIGTIDNDGTITEIRFLALVAAHTVSAEERERDQKGALRGIRYLLHAQFPNGGWPQVWPLMGGYHDALTFNDDAMIQATEVMAGAASGKDEFAFVPAELRKECAASVERANQVILKTQIKVHGKLTVWCQQHDALTLAPVGARNYEMPSLSSGESASLIDYLMRLPHPTAQMVASVYAGTAWLESSAVHGFAYGGGRNDPKGRRLMPDASAPPVWARYYSMETGKPIFGDRDKTIHDELSEISMERRNGYAWYNTQPNRTLAQFAVWKKEHPAK